MGTGVSVKARRDRSHPSSEVELEKPRSAQQVPESAPWLPGESDIHALTVPPGEYPTQNLPGSIEEAALNALDQVPAASRPAASSSQRAPATTPPPARPRRGK